MSVLLRRRSNIGNKPTLASGLDRSHLVMELGFGENTGTVSRDKSGHGRNGVVTAWASGYTDTAAVGDASHSAIQYSGTLLSSGSSFSMLYRFYPTKTDDYSSISSIFDTVNGYWIEPYWIGGELSMGHTSSAGYGAGSWSGDPITPTLNAWNTIAITYNASTQTLVLYVNGSAAFTVTSVGNYGAPNWVEAGGQQHDRGNYNMGRVDDFRILDVALSPSDVVAWFAAPIGIVTDTLLGYDYPSEANFYHDGEATITLSTILQFTVPGKVTHIKFPIPGDLVGFDVLGSFASINEDFVSGATNVPDAVPSAYRATKTIAPGDAYSWGTIQLPTPRVINTSNYYMSIIQIHGKQSYYAIGGWFNNAHPNASGFIVGPDGDETRSDGFSGNGRYGYDDGWPIASFNNALYHADVVFQLA